MIDLNQQTELRKSIELLYFAYRSFTSRADRILEERGLGRVHHRILYFVGHNPDVAVNALLAILKVSKQALNGPLRQLVEMGLISATVADHDRRVKLLRLTNAGQALEDRLTGAQMELLASVFDTAGPNSADGWRKVMEALARET
jgi:DNA-binding MarR family transcriptional regulator